MTAHVGVTPPVRARRGPGLADRLAASACVRSTDPADLVAWLHERRETNPFRVARVGLDSLVRWRFEPGSGDLVHASGRFFSVRGLHVRTDTTEWSQPILDQPDRSILGILALPIDGVLHFLMQAKMEPGNTNLVQLSPTVQATVSNYQRAHAGGRSCYLEYFVEPGRARVLVDVLQSEQGSWFRGKRNRNILMEARAPVAVHPDFRWLTLGDLYALLTLPNVVNMDTRTVLSCLPLVCGVAPTDGFAVALQRSTLDDDELALSPTVEISSWLTERKAAHDLETWQRPLRSLPGWKRTGSEIHHVSGRYFRIVGVAVQASNREVGSWCQPLLAPSGVGLVAFLARRIEGVLHVLARADVRPGYRDVVELGPTVQCTPANFAHASRRPEYLDLVLSSDVTVRYDVVQSEEGGRFDHAVTRHLLVEVDQDFPLTTGPDYRWVTLAQLKALMRSSYQVNIEARSLVTCLHALGAT